MSDVDKLLARFETGAFLRPCAELPNIVDLARALAWLAQAPGIELTAGATELSSLIGCSDHLIFVLADGLGMNLLETLPGSTFLATHLVAELRTVFPSTTAVALTALATGEWPNKHGVTGQWTHLPHIRVVAALLPFATRTGNRPLRRLGVSIPDAFPLPSVIEDVKRDTLAIFPEMMVDGISSAYFSGYRARSGYNTLSEATDTILARVRSATAPTYTYLYVPQIDAAAHWHGIGHPNVLAAALELDQEMERLASGLGESSRIVLSADHGFLDAPITARHWIKPSADLFDSLVFPPSGDSRVMYFHVHEGAEERIRQRFARDYGDRFLLITVEEAECIGLFGPGPLSPETRNRLGNLMAISGGADVIEYLHTGSGGRVRSIASFHSGLTPEEMRIPLVLAGPV